MDCIFCAISKKEKQAEILYENNQVIVFRDIHPSAPVHLLVVPKLHITSVNELTDENRDLAGTLILTAKIAAHNSGIADGYRISINVGEKGGQMVQHLHVHVQGGWEESA